MKQKTRFSLIFLILIFLFSTQINAQCLCTYFTAFNVSKNSCTANLSWSTATEPLGSKFLIFRSNNGSTFTQIATVQGNSGSSTIRNYYYSDVNPYNPSHSYVYYYIKNINIDRTVADQTPIKNVNMLTCSGSPPPPPPSTPQINGSNNFYFSATVRSGGGTINAIPGTVVTVTVSAGGPPSGPYSTSMYISGASFSSGGTSLSTSGSSGSSATNTFVMPSSSYVNWTGNFSEPNTSGSGGIDVQ